MYCKYFHRDDWRGFHNCPNQYANAHQDAEEVKMLRLSKETKKRFDDLMQKEVSKRIANLNRMEYFNLMKENKRILSQDQFLNLLMDKYL